MRPEGNRGAKGLNDGSFLSVFGSIVYPKTLISRPTSAPPPTPMSYLSTSKIESTYKNEASKIVNNSVCVKRKLPYLNLGKGCDSILFVGSCIFDKSFQSLNRHFPRYKLK